MTFIVIDGTLVTLQAAQVDGLVVFRLSKHYGITHAVWPVLPRLEGNSPHTETLCRLQLDVPWRNSGRFRSGKIDCMSCFVRMSRITS